MMTPFLSAGSGISQDRDIELTPVDTPVNDCGAPDGTVCTKRKNQVHIISAIKLFTEIIFVVNIIVVGAKLKI